MLNFRQGVKKKPYLSKVERVFWLTLSTGLRVSPAPLVLSPSERQSPASITETERVDTQPLLPHNWLYKKSVECRAKL
jgi:hypothetical protein